MIFLVVALSLIRCGLGSKQSIYEGVRSQQKIKDVSSDPKFQSLSSYDQYNEKREEQLKKSVLKIKYIIYDLKIGVFNYY